MDSNMKTLKYGSTGDDVMYLCQLLGIRRETIFDKTLEGIVIEYQSKKGLPGHGSVDFDTWESLMLDYRLLHYPTLDVIELDYTMYSKLFDCSSKVLYAVEQTCSNGSGFISQGKPRIFFEASVFWEELEKLGLRPDRYLSGNSDILSKEWNKSLFKGGEKEWTRLGKAERLDKIAAQKSTTWGLFQILGRDYKLCGCNTLGEFTEAMKSGTHSQFLLGMRYIKNTGAYKFLAENKFIEFGRVFKSIPEESSKFISELGDIFDRQK